MNEKTEIDVRANDRVLDPIEWRDHCFKLGLEETQTQVRTREQSRNSDALAANVPGVQWTAGDEARTIPVSHRRAVGQERVPVGEIRVRVNRHGGDFELGS